MGDADRADRLALRLTPSANSSDKTLREHVDNVLVLIDTERAFILAFQMTDADQERTVIRFSNVKTNASIDDARLRLHLPPGIKTVRPLENLGAPSGTEPPASRTPSK
jgi:outer membrane lipoprotein-sorting protein